MSEYAVSASSLTGVIYAGVLNPNKTSYRNKSEVTSQVIAAIEDHVRHRFDGGAEFTRRTADGKTVTVHITIEEEATT